MALEWICVLFVVGLAFMFAEPFIPAGGVLGVIGLVCFGAAVFFGFRFSTWLGVIQLAVGVIFGIFTVNLFFRRMAHTGQQQASPQLHEASEEELLGARGEALTPLRPTGQARFGDKRVSVLTRGDMIERGTALIVEEVHGNRIFVCAAPAEVEAPVAAAETPEQPEQP